MFTLVQQSFVQAEVTVAYAHSFLPPGYIRRIYNKSCFCHHRLEGSFSMPTACGCFFIPPPPDSRFRAFALSATEAKSRASILEGILCGTRRTPNLAVLVILGHTRGPQSIYLGTPHVYIRVPSEYISGYPQRIYPGIPRAYTWIPREYIYPSMHTLESPQFRCVCPPLFWSQSIRKIIIPGVCAI